MQSALLTHAQTTAQALGSSRPCDHVCSTVTWHNLAFLLDTWRGCLQRWSEGMADCEHSLSGPFVASLAPLNACSLCSTVVRSGWRSHVGARKSAEVFRTSAALLCRPHVHAKIWRCSPKRNCVSVSLVMRGSLQRDRTRLTTVMLVASATRIRRMGCGVHTSCRLRP